MVLFDRVLSHVCHFQYILVTAILCLLFNRYKTHHNPAEPWSEMELREFILRVHFVFSSFSLILQCFFFFFKDLFTFYVHEFLPRHLSVPGAHHLCSRCMKKLEDCVRALVTGVNGGCKTTWEGWQTTLSPVQGHPVSLATVPAPKLLILSA